MNSRKKILAVTIPVVFLLDQFTKYLIVLYLPQGSSLPILPGLFDIVHSRNKGAAFGFMSGLPDSIRLPFFFILSLIALLLIVIYFIKMKDDRASVSLCLGLILGGAAGNIFDRIRLGEVVDFLSFHWYDKVVSLNRPGYSMAFRLEWPAFNVADSAISIAVNWLLILMLFPKKS